MTRNRFFLALSFCVFALFAACNEKESDLGVDLQDPATLYEGICDTAYGTAYTVFDDSLQTSSQSNALIGCYSDDVFGSSEGVLFMQITTADNAGVEFDQNSLIDSAILSFSLATIYPESLDSKSYRDLHFEVYQLAEPVLRDSAYYAFDELAVNGTCFFDGTVRVEQSDSMVASMRLNDNFISYVRNKSYASSTDFEAAMKGIRVRLVNGGTPQAATINLAAAGTGLGIHYRYANGSDTIARTYNFVVSQTAPHFCQFKNNYIGALSTFNTNTSDSIEGSQYLYLSPMGGTNVKVNFNSFVQQFHADHPYAVIHYAELQLPVADLSPAYKPDMVAALKLNADGSMSSVQDMYDVSFSGYDGTYSENGKYYRLRITQHLQKMLKAGSDYGTLLVLNARRSSPARMVLNGTSPSATGNNPIRIRFVYSE